jgi:hypothetical protein
MAEKRVRRSRPQPPAISPQPRPSRSERGSGAHAEYSSTSDHRGAGMRRLFRENGLSIVLVFLFLVFWAGHSVAGHREYNAEQREHGEPQTTYTAYLGSSHFWESTAENWESEFLQIFSYVFLTVFLFQKGSAESKKPDEPEPVDRDPRESGMKADAPWPVRRGGFLLKLYEYSLSLAFLLIFLVSITLHALAGSADYNQEQRAHGELSALSPLQYAGTSRFWFESFQNWQSEFLAIAAVVVFSIFLRQRGSPESKPVDSPHDETGTE